MRCPATTTVQARNPDGSPNPDVTGTVQCLHNAQHDPPHEAIYPAFGKVESVTWA